MLLYLNGIKMYAKGQTDTRRSSIGAIPDSRYRELIELTVEGKHEYASVGRRHL